MMTPSNDTIQLSTAIFASLGAAGALNGDLFVSGPGLTTTVDMTVPGNDDDLVYDTTSGKLYYDAAGNGVGVSQQFATLIGTPAILANDFVVI